MKKLLLFITCIFCLYINGFSQTTIDSSTTKAGKDSVISQAAGTDSISARPYDPSQVFTKVEVAPKSPSNWSNYLKNNLNAAVGANNGAPPGAYTVIIEFIVGSDGSIHDVKALTNFGYGMEEEAMRVIKNSPAWIPARQNGYPVNAYRVQPVVFHISAN
jgi:Gram-negative bacterial TonB protein C-terminal